MKKVMLLGLLFSIVLFPQLKAAAESTRTESRTVSHLLPVSFNPTTKKWSVLLFKLPGEWKWDSLKANFSIELKAKYDDMARQSAEALQMATFGRYNKDNIKGYKILPRAFHMRANDIQLFLFMNVPFIKGGILSSQDRLARGYDFIWVNADMIRDIDSRQKVGFYEESSYPIEPILLNFLQFSLPVLDGAGGQFFEKVESLVQEDTDLQQRYLGSALDIQNILGAEKTSAKRRD